MQGSGEAAAGGPAAGPGAPVDWRRRPCRTSAAFAAANSALWLVSVSPLRAYSLLAFLLALLVVMVTLRDAALRGDTGAQVWRNMAARWEMMDSGPDRRSRAGPPLADSLKLFIQETSAFKQQNPGKFCLLVCSICTFFAVLGRYIPGIVISYALVLSVFLWPLISSHEVGLWLKPVLQKLDFGIGELLRKIKEDHERRLLRSQAEKDAVESDLSSMFPKLDSTACKEMSVSDTEVSDVTWTDNGTFNLSEGHTPQTENSEDLDKEEVFSGGLHEFPSLDNGATTNGDEEEDFSLGPPPAPPRSSSESTSRTVRPEDAALEMVHQLAGSVITAAVTAAIQERIEAAAAVAGLPRASRPLLPDPAEESDSEAEDFELLDQSELEQLEGELGLGGAEAPAREEPQDAAAAAAAATSAGFFSKLLRRQ